MTQDLERQLARYGMVLRAGAGPVDLEEADTLRRQSSTLYRPARAVAAGAALVLASIGLLFLGLTIVDLFSSGPLLRSTVAGPSGRVNGPGIVALVTGGSAIALMGLTAVLGLRRRYLVTQQNRAVLARERKKKKMQTLEKPLTPLENLERNNRYLIVALVVMTLAAVGLGAWLIVENTRSATERDIGNLLDNYSAAWEANDGEAVLALMTEGGSIKAGDGVTYRADSLQAAVDSLGAFNSQRLGDFLIMEKSNYWLVAEAGAIEYGGRTSNEMAVFKVVERDGEYLIDYHETWLAGS